MAGVTRRTWWCLGGSRWVRTARCTWRTRATRPCAPSPVERLTAWSPPLPPPPLPAARGGGGFAVSAAHAARASRRRTRPHVRFLDEPAPIGRVLGHLHEGAHLAQPAVDALSHALAQKLRVARRALGVLRGAVARGGRGAGRAALGLQRVVRREERGAARVVATGDELIERLHLELAAAPLAHLVDGQHRHVRQRADDLPSALALLEAA